MSNRRVLILVLLFTFTILLSSLATSQSIANWPQDVQLSVGESATVNVGGISRTMTLVSYGSTTGSLSTGNTITATVRVDGGGKSETHTMQVTYAGVPVVVNGLRIYAYAWKEANSNAFEDVGRQGGFPVTSGKAVAFGVQSAASTLYPSMSQFKYPIDGVFNDGVFFQTFLDPDGWAHSGYDIGVHTGQELIAPIDGYLWAQWYGDQGQVWITPDNNQWSSTCWVFTHVVPGSLTVSPGTFVTKGTVLNNGEIYGSGAKHYHMGSCGSNDFGSFRFAAEVWENQHKDDYPVPRYWLAAGPFPGTISTSASGEAAIQPMKGDSLTVGSTTKQWKFADAYANGVLRVGELLSARPYSGYSDRNPSNSMAYLTTYVYSPASKSATIKLGTSRTAQIWVNGASVFTDSQATASKNYYNSFSVSTQPSLVEDQYSIPITLQAGWNTLTIKSDHGTSSALWSLLPKIGTSSGTRDPQLIFSTRDIKLKLNSWSGGTASVSWTPVNWHGVNVQNYIVEASTTPSFSTIAKSTTVSGSSSSASLSGLTSGTNYYIRVRPYNNDDLGGTTYWEHFDMVQTSGTPAQPDNLKVLFIGNSLTAYNGHIGKHIAGMAAADGVTIEWAKAHKGGTRLDQHWADQRGVAEIESGEFDIVVLQPWYWAGGSVASFKQAVRNYDAVIKANGAETWIYQAYPDGGCADPTAFCYHGSGLYQEIIDATEDIADEVDGTVVPVLKAWGRNYEYGPGYDLYSVSDSTHPNLKGTYLTSALFYFALTGTSPVGNTYSIPGSDGLLDNPPGDTGNPMTSAQESALQQVAHDVWLNIPPSGGTTPGAIPLPSTNPPNGLAVKDTPLFVVFGSDDNNAGNSGGQADNGVSFLANSIKGRTNPDGTPWRMTFYTMGGASFDSSWEKTLFQQIARDGNEIGNHQMGPEVLSTYNDWLTTWTNADSAIRQMLVDGGLDPDDDRSFNRRGIRTHQDQMSDNAIQAAKDLGYAYHASHVTGHSGTSNGITWFPGSMEVEWPGAAFWDDRNYNPIDGMMEIPQHYYGTSSAYCDSEHLPTDPTAAQSDKFANDAIASIQASLNTNHAPVHFCIHDWKYPPSRQTNRDAILKIEDWIETQQAAGVPIYVVTNGEVYDWMRNPVALGGSPTPPQNTAPTVTIVSPTSPLIAGTTSTTLTVSTNENADCRHSTTSGQSFTSMTAFTATGGTTHSTTITGLTNGVTRNVYVKCRDKASTPLTSADKLAAITVQNVLPTGDFTITINANNEVYPFKDTIRGVATNNWNYIWEALWDRPGYGCCPPGKHDTIVAAAVPIKPGIIRFAGGLWANAVGWDRNGVSSSDDGGWTWTSPTTGKTYTYSHRYHPQMVDAYYEILQETGAEGLIQVNVCDNNLEMWADLVRYSKEKGYDFKYWEIGNEQTLESCGLTADTFAQRYKNYRTALRAVDPNIKVMSSAAHQPTYENWEDVIVSQNNGNIDVLTWHWYQLSEWTSNTASFAYQGGSVAALLAHDGNVGTAAQDGFGPAGAIQSIAPGNLDRWTYRRGIAEQKMDYIEDHYRAQNPNMETAITEFGPHASDHDGAINSNHLAAIWLADVLPRWAYNGLDIVTFYSYEDGGNGDQSDNSRGLVGTSQDAGGSLDIRPIYYTELLLADHFGDMMVQSSTTDPEQKLVGWASTDSDDPGKLKVILVNLHGTAKTAAVAVNGMNIQSGLSWTMASDNPLDMREPQSYTSDSTKINGRSIRDVPWGNIAQFNADIAAIRNSGVAVSGIQNNILTYQVPAYSVVALELSTTGTAPGDTTPPVLTSATASGSSVIATFNEPLHISASQLSGNYRISSSTDSNYATPRAPTSAVLSSDGRSVTLTLPTALAAGMTYTLTANDIQDLAGNVKSTQSQTFSTAVTAIRYNTIPGKLEAENYSTGGQNIGYFDTTSTNLGDSTYRNDGVDVESNGEGGLSIGYVEVGEWVSYDIDVQQAGSYTVTARVASAGSGTKTFHLEQNGVDISGPISFQPTGGWSTWTTVSVNQVALVAGKQQIRVVMDTPSINLDYLTFQLGAAVPGNKICEAGEETSYPDDCKSFIGSITDINTNFNLGILVDGSSNIFQWFTSLLPVQIVENTGSGTVSRVTLHLPFQDRLQLLLNGLDIRKQPADSTKGYLIVEGLPDNQVKTVLVDRIANSDRVCIKDTAASDIGQITPGCNGPDEFLLTCNGVTDANGYTCTIQGQYFNVSGLRN